MPAATACATRCAPGSETPGMPASETKAMREPAKQFGDQFFRALPFVVSMAAHGGERKFQSATAVSESGACLHTQCDRRCARPQCPQRNVFQISYGSRNDIKSRGKRLGPSSVIARSASCGVIAIRGSGGLMLQPPAFRQQAHAVHQVLQGHDAYDPLPVHHRHQG